MGRAERKDPLERGGQIELIMINSRLIIAETSVEVHAL